MRIDRVTLLRVALRLRAPFASSSHAAHELHHLLVRVEGGGLVGWGECAAPRDPFYTGETDVTAWHALGDFIAPRAVGREWRTVDELAASWAAVKGHWFAKAGLEMAAWDLLGRAQGASLASLLGATRARVECGVSLGIEPDRGRLLDEIARHLAAGYRRVKLKIAPGRDLDVVADVRARFPDLALLVDANSAYTLADADRLAALDEHRLVAIEQPLAWDDLAEHAALQRRLATPIALDESIRSVADARLAVDLGACRAINVKGPRVGGLAEARRVAELAASRGVAVWCGGMHEYGVGRAAAIALAAHPAFTIAPDLSGSERYYEEDLVTPPLTADRGALAVPTGPGLGVAVVDERVARRTLDRREIP